MIDTIKSLLYVSARTMLLIVHSYTRTNKDFQYLDMENSLLPAEDAKVTMNKIYTSIFLELMVKEDLLQERQEKLPINTIHSSK